jgi:predicted DNA-binding transcriptional regulator AlpA
LPCKRIQSWMPESAMARQSESSESTFPSSGLVRLKAILRVVPVSESTWWNMVDDGRAPKPIKFSDNITVWTAESIHELIRNISSSEPTATPRLIGPGSRLNGVSKQAYLRLSMCERRKLIEQWRVQARSMIVAPCGKLNRQGRRFINRINGWELLIDSNNKLAKSGLCSV